MLLSEMLKAIGGNIGNITDFELKGVTCSSTAVRPGYLFFALKGAAVDGHSFIPAALEKGAGAVIGQDDYASDKYIRVEDSRHAFTIACAEFWGNPQRELKLCGVTGTNGKTTVSNIIRTIILGAGKDCGLMGTVENIVGGRHIPAHLTTPGPEELYPMLREMADCGSEFCAMEVSSHALAGERVSGMEFSVGVFTNLTRDHLDFHKTMEAYAEAKCKLMEQSGISVINADDPAAPLFMEHSRKYVTYGIDNKADFMASNVECTPLGVKFTCPFGEIALPPGGRFSVYNALAAACAASCLGISDEDIHRGLCGFTSVSGRMEPLKVKGDYHIYIDYAHTPDGLENVLGAIKEFAGGKIITVFGCGGDRDKTKRPMMGEIASRLSDFCVVTNDNPRTENPSGIIADILKGVSGNQFVAIEDRKEAIRFAIRMAQPGDVILLAGKGHETYQIIGTEKLHLDERELVAEVELEEGIG